LQALQGFGVRFLITMNVTFPKSIDRHYPLILSFLGAFSAFVVSLFAISGQSLWIDEGNSALKAVAPTWAEFSARMLQYRGSDLQMPGYMTLLWLWQKAWGPSELALRSLNIPFFCLAVFVVCIALKSSRKVKVLFVIFSCSSPFLWAYLDEARPYMMQFFSSCLVAVGLLNLCLCTQISFVMRNLLLTVAGMLILLSSSLSTVFFVFFLGLALISILSHSAYLHLISRQILTQISLLVFLLLGVFLGIYFYWTLSVGAKASNVGHTTLFSSFFCIYELFGFLGHGPSRADLRVSPLVFLQTFVWPLSSYAVSLSIFFIFLIWKAVGRKCRFDRRVLIICAALLLSVISLLLVGIFAPFRVTGRHLMPVFPFFLLGLAFLTARAFHQSRSLSIVFLFVYFVFASTSCFSLRLAFRHSKDDYRSAAQWLLKHTEPGDVVWWAADFASGRYYKILPQHSSTTLLNSPLHIMNPDLSYLRSVPPAKFIALSKLDVYDANGAIQQWLKTNSFQQVASFQSFTIWAHP